VIVTIAVREVTACDPERVLGADPDPLDPHAASATVVTAARPVSQIVVPIGLC
jgi:hypothetical protein